MKKYLQYRKNHRIDIYIYIFAYRIILFGNFPILLCYIVLYNFINLYAQNSIIKLQFLIRNQFLSPRYYEVFSLFL